MQTGLNRIFLGGLINDLLAPGLLNSFNSIKFCQIFLHANKTSNETIKHVTSYFRSNVQAVALWCMIPVSLAVYEQNLLVRDSRS